MHSEINILNQENSTLKFVTFKPIYQQGGCWGGGGGGDRMLVGELY